MRILVTGGAGFIGCHLIKALIEQTNYQVANLDALTYAGNLMRLKDFRENWRYYFYQANINNLPQISTILANYQPEAIFHLAAETHVDRSIKNAENFILSNINGTYQLLEAVRIYLGEHQIDNFRFIHVSTDEVYGDLLSQNPATEDAPYLPNSPYSASKAASNHLVRAWQQTYDIPCIITNCSNNYGAKQHPEKFIPKIIHHALNEQKIPIYGDGMQVRNWIYVEDHIDALLKVLKNGVIGETYNIGSNINEINNLQLTYKICDILQNVTTKNYRHLIEFVKDRKAHDQKYALNTDKIRRNLNWHAKTDLDSGLQKTIDWYITNPKWINSCKL